ncbi:ornithine cyclodeaminase family protein [Rhodosalinus halophilus]|uniref:Ornithine cyclodeaminase family protein n=1 Tax=Rhodosalinus halophilus TaxID=2259333 RepID=A0A365U9F4_9RHOB|nr:ornithine cyclodeaminase family protein [Rhodosalinus halophilus]RBI85157.1 ornithine cyclodeaminase family protein [Rhodosalinus halophilus]
MRVLNARDVAALLPMAEAIDVVEAAMRRVSSGGAEMPLRQVVPVGEGRIMGVMPGALDVPAAYGVKIVSIFADNPARGLSSHRGAVALFEAETGGCVAMIEAGLLTAIRTAAASAVASRALARPGAERLVLIGHGEQAEHHLAAMRAVRPVTRVTVIGRDAARAAAFAERMRVHHPALVIESGTDAEAALRAADLVCTVTNSSTPVLHGDWLQPGQHVNAVGASVPTKRELDDTAVLRSAVFCDFRASFFAQAGEIVDMTAAGRIGPEHLHAEIGEVLSGAAEGRRGDADITLYRSLGVAAQDLAVAHHVWRRAVADGRGIEAPF